ncbi:hypothetical protein SCUP515_07725 [Seiridium cupressi]
MRFESLLVLRSYDVAGGIVLKYSVTSSSPSNTSTALSQASYQTSTASAEVSLSSKTSESSTASPEATTTSASSSLSAVQACRVNFVPIRRFETDDSPGWSGANLQVVDEDAGYGLAAEGAYFAFVNWAAIQDTFDFILYHTTSGITGTKLACSAILKSTGSTIAVISISISLTSCAIMAMYLRDWAEILSGDAYIIALSDKPMYFFFIISVYYGADNAHTGVPGMIPATSLPNITSLREGLDYGNSHLTRCNVFYDDVRGFRKKFHTSTGLPGPDLHNWKLKEHQAGLDEMTAAYLDRDGNGPLYWPDSSSSANFNKLHYSKDRTRCVLLQFRPARLELNKGQD